jgi:hypothetical protein
MTTLHDIEMLALQHDKEAIARLCLFSAVETAVRYGEIQTVGRSETEIQTDILDYVEQIVSYEDADSVPLRWIAVHRDLLLDRARSFNDLGCVDDSLLYYATWIEHWLNDAISTTLRRRGFKEDFIVSVLREVNLRGKTSWLLLLLGLPPIGEALASQILQITEARNAFVHFKFPSRDVDESPVERQRLQGQLASAESLVSALTKYEGEHITGESRRIALRFIGLQE